MILLAVRNTFLSKEHLKEDVYNEIYGQRGYKKKKGLLAWLHSSLNRYEENRCTVVFKLLEKGGRLLDVGCGNGDFCIMAKQLFDATYGVDVSSVRIFNAASKVKNRVDKDSFYFMQHDIDESLPFPNDFFDIVTCVATLEYVVYPRRVIMEVQRVLKPGGHFILQVSNIAFLPNRFALLIGKLPTAGGIDENGVDWERLHSFNKKIVVTLVERTKLKVVSLTCSGIFARLRKIYPSLLAGDIIIKAKKPKVKQRGQSASAND